MGPYLVQLDLGPKLVQLVLGWPISTGCIKKMVHSDFSLKSVPGVRFYFFRGVLNQNCVLEPSEHFNYTH